MSLAGPSRYTQQASSEEDEDTEFAHHSFNAEGSTDDEHPDAPRVAQWVGEDDLDSEDSIVDEQGDDEESSNFTALKRDLSKLPLGALVKAHETIKTAPQESDSDADGGSSSGEESQIQSRGWKRGEASTSTPKDKRPIEHRSNKHAPMEVTSKKPVPRRRQIVETHAVRPRDPRFSDLSGKLSSNHFHAQYNFLQEIHVNELSTLKLSLTRARKLLISSPRHLREDREKEVNRLELAVKRAESTVNREKREVAERQALDKIHQEEKEKRKDGKKGWWLKDADENAIRVRARMDAIAASGGKRAVKKAIEKRQRKIGQKEKKSRPFAPPQRAGQKRTRDGAEGSEVRKRQRVNE